LAFEGLGGPDNRDEIRSTRRESFVSRGRIELEEWMDVPAHAGYFVPAKPYCPDAMTGWPDQTVA
jgi:hypothetical protein